jgi:hypothetical protein
VGFAQAGLEERRNPGDTTAEAGTPVDVWEALEDRYFSAGFDCGQGGAQSGGSRPGNDDRPTHREIFVAD